MAHVLTRMARGEKGLTWTPRTVAHRESGWRRGATRLGITFDEYRDHIHAGEKWCSGHKSWHVLVETPFIGKRGSGDGLGGHCKRFLREYIGSRRAAS